MEAPMSLVIPSDIAGDLRYALEDCREHAYARAFLELVAAGVEWDPRRPRKLIAWAQGKHRVCVDGTRLLVCVLTGFAGGYGREWIGEAKAVLRAAAADVAGGREAPVFVGEGVIAFDEPRELRLDDWWGAHDSHMPNPVLPLSSSEAAALRQQFPAPPAAVSPSAPPAPVSSPAAPSSGPRFQRGTNDYAAVELVAQGALLIAVACAATRLRQSIRTSRSARLSCISTTLADYSQGVAFGIPESAVR
jgi:hypothetical protein